MKPQTTHPSQLAAVSLPVHRHLPLVDLACLLRHFGLRLHWNSQRRILETLPI